MKSKKINISIIATLIAMQITPAYAAPLVKKVQGKRQALALGVKQTVLPQNLLPLIVAQCHQEAELAAIRATKRRIASSQELVSHVFVAIGGGAVGATVIGILNPPVLVGITITGVSVATGELISNVANRSHRNMIEATYQVTYNETFMACYKRERANLLKSP